MGSDAFFALLGTLAQVLGGALGLIAAFVVYYLGELDRRLEGVLKHVEREFLRSREGESIAELLAEGDLVGAARKADASPLTTPLYRSFCRQAESIVRQRQPFRLKAKVAMMTSVFAVVGVISAMALESSFSPPHRVVAASISWLVFVWSLGLLVDLVSVLWTDPGEA